MAEIDVKPLTKNIALELSKLKDIKVPELKFPIFKPQAQIEYEERQEQRRKRYREDYKFYQKCLRVLSEKKGKEKLISYIREEMRIIEIGYNL